VAFYLAEGILYYDAYYLFKMLGTLRMLGFLVLFTVFTGVEFDIYGGCVGYWKKNDKAFYYILIAKAGSNFSYSYYCSSYGSSSILSSSSLSSGVSCYSTLDLF